MHYNIHYEYLWNALCIMALPCQSVVTLSAGYIMTVGGKMIIFETLNYSFIQTLMLSGITNGLVF